MADDFGCAYVRRDDTPQPHNHPITPTLAELIEQCDGIARTTGGAHWTALAAHLRELERLRAAVQEGVTAGRLRTSEALREFC